MGLEKRKGIGALLAIGLFLGICPQVPANAETETVNLAIGKAIYAASPAAGAEHLIDGSMGTSYSVPWGGEKFVTIDLGIPCEISGIEVERVHAGIDYHLAPAVFYASNNPDMPNVTDAESDDYREVLHSISEGAAIADGNYTASVNPGRAYRYVQIRRPSGFDGPLAELRILGAAKAPLVKSLSVGEKDYVSVDSPRFDILFDAPADISSVTADNIRVDKEGAPVAVTLSHITAAGCRVNMEGLQMMSQYTLTVENIRSFHAAVTAVSPVSKTVFRTGGLITVTSFMFTDQNGEALSQLPPDFAVTVKAAVSNTAANKKEVVLFAALYDQYGRIADGACFKAGISPGTSETVQCVITTPADTADMRISAVLADGFSYPLSYMDVRTFPQEMPLKLSPEKIGAKNTVSIQTSGNLAAVRGILPSAAQSRCTGLVFAPGVAPADIQSGSLNGKLLAADFFTVTNARGGYTMEFTLPDGEESGQCTVVVTSEKSPQGYADSFYYAKPSDLQRLMNDINGFADGGAAFEYIGFASQTVLSEMTAAGMDIAYYHLLRRESKMQVCAALAAGTFAGAGAYREAAGAFNLQTALGYIGDSENSDGDVEMALAHFEDVLGIISSPYYQRYQSLADSGNGYAVAKLIKSEAKSDTAAFSAHFARAVALAGLNAASTVSQVSLQLADTIFGVGMQGKYSQLSEYEKRQVLSVFLDNAYTDIAKVKKDFDDTVSLLSEKKSPNTGSSPGPGGKTTAAFSYPIPEPLPNAAEKTGVRFDDTAHLFWAAKYIDALAERGIVKGYDNNRFFPDLPVTREQFLHMVVNAFAIGGGQEDSGGAFSDVGRDDWFYETVLKAFAAGIVQGESDGTFGAGKTISRQDAAVIMHRAVSGLGLETIYTSGAKEDIVFTDMASISGYAVRSVNDLSRAGVIQGSGGGRFEPAASATRAQAAVMLWRLLDAAEKL